MRIFNIHEAKTHLSSLAEDVAAGEEIIIAKAGRPVMKLVPLGKKKKRQIGFLPGQIRTSPDFDAPLPDDVLDAFEGKL